MRLGELIKSVCSRASSMNQAAKKSGVSQGTLSEWQSEKVSPGLEKYIELCLAMGCRPGYELDQYLGLGSAKPKTAEDLLGMALGLSPVEQQRLISLLAGKYSEYLAVQQMIDVNCLISLIIQHLEADGITPETFCQKRKIDEGQFTALMHGILPASIEETEVLISLLSMALKNPTTGEKFDSREELIDYCNTRRLSDNQQREPNGTGRH
ncbi:MAG: helix-turn-helix domain-containing protein [Dolichospermum sp.]|jgi:transcriptional regulator with XRE-family HTH domain